MDKLATYNYLEDYLNEVQSKGRFTVTLEELKNNFSSTEKAILQNIYRLKKKNQLAQVRKGFYVIVPPQYSTRGMLPPTLFIDELMRFLKRDYYIALFSASAMHGAGHQQPMLFQVMTKKPPLRSIKNNKLDIHFFIKSYWPKEEIVQIKTDTGYIHVSSPAATAFDLVQYHQKIGGINRIIPILEELMESMNSSDLKKSTNWQTTPVLQRMGYLLEQMGKEQLASVLYCGLEGRSLRSIPISLAHKTHTGVADQKWKIIENIKLDF